MMTMYLDSANPNLKDICSGSSLFGLDDGNAVTGDAFSRYDTIRTVIICLMVKRFASMEE